MPELNPKVESIILESNQGFIREVKYPTWIANIVLVRKKNGQLALFFSIDKLRHYMQAFMVHLVVKADPIKYVLFRASVCRLSGRPPSTVKLEVISGAGLSIILISPEKHMLPYSFVLAELCSNNLSLQYDVKHENLKSYFAYARQLMERFDSVMLEHVPRTENKRADTLANLATALTMPDDVNLNIPLYQRWIVPPIVSEC
ncbi:uncharacterized protein E6C27_scaffold79G001530 [Cucumis melo var. makuwa]|uniref:RNase H type-1 domain-containing protein n=1 Tax=Cucumis melo var. makuwa TaxID=1194695 RepID=A0A5A7V5X8_CUCMM|nr:uncharacterized protein E6C27_scaffold79G001530 [Cucumis melo var. makuwa]